MRRRITYLPGKAASIFAALVGLVMVGMGIFIVIPLGGAFGVLWTLVAAGITGLHLYNAFGGKHAGHNIRIEEEPDPGEQPRGPVEMNAKERLEQLESLRSAGLISQKEYEERREQILDRL